MAKYEQTLCWQCKNTDRFKCPWFNPDNPQPVDGWVAERYVKPTLGETYLVKECPKFEPIPGAKHRREMQRLLASCKKDDGATSYPGVHRGKRNWVARICWHGKRYYLGYFATEKKAIAAVKAAEKAIARGEEPCKQ